MKKYISFIIAMIILLNNCSIFCFAKSYTSIDIDTENILNDSLINIETTSKEQSTETTSKEQSTETTSKEQSTETTSKEQSTETTSKEQSTETTLKEQSTETTSKEQSTETTSKEQSTETTSKEQSTETTSKEQSTETTSKEQSTETSSGLEFGKDYFYEDLILNEGQVNYSLTEGISYDKNQYVLGISDKGNFDINIPGEYTVNYVLVGYKTKQIAASFSRIVKVIENEQNKYIYNLPTLNLPKGESNFDLLKDASILDKQGNSLKLYIKDLKDFDINKVGTYKILIGVESLEIEKERIINVFLDNTYQEVNPTKINVKFGEQFKVYDSLKEAFENHKQDSEMEIILDGEYTLSKEDINILSQEFKETLIIKGKNNTILNVDNDLKLNGQYVKFENLNINFLKENLFLDSNSLFLEIQNVNFGNNLPNIYGKNYVTLQNTKINSIKAFGIISILEEVVIENEILGFKDINVGNGEILTNFYVGKIDSTQKLDNEPTILASFSTQDLKNFNKNSIDLTEISINLNEINKKTDNVNLLGKASIIFKQSGSIIENINAFGIDNNIIVPKFEEAPITLKNEVEAQENINIGVFEILQQLNTEDGILELEKEIENDLSSYPIIKYELEEEANFIKGFRDFRVSKEDFETQLSKKDKILYYKIFKGFGKQNLYMMRVSDDFFEQNPDYTLEQLKKIYKDNKNKNVIAKRSFDDTYSLFSALKSFGFEGNDEKDNNLVIFINKDFKNTSKNEKEYLYFIDEKLTEIISEFGINSENSKIIIAGIPGNYNNDMLSADTNLFIGNPNLKNEKDEDYFINVNSELVFKNIDIETPAKSNSQLTLYMNGNKFIADENVSATIENYEKLSTFGINEYYEEIDKKGGLNIIIDSETKQNPINIKTDRYFNINNIAIPETVFDKNINLTINIDGNNVWVNKVFDKKDFEKDYKHNLPKKRSVRATNQKDFSIKGGNIGSLNVSSNAAKIDSNLQTLEVEMGSTTEIAKDRQIVNIISDSTQNSPTKVINNADVSNVIIGAKTNPNDKKTKSGIFEFTFENNGNIENLQFGTKENSIGAKDVKVINNSFIKFANGSITAEDANVNKITYEGGTYEQLIGGGGHITLSNVVEVDTYYGARVDENLGDITNNVTNNQSTSSRFKNFVGGNAPINENITGLTVGIIINNVQNTDCEAFIGGNLGSIVSHIESRRIENTFNGGTTGGIKKVYIGGNFAGNVVEEIINNFSGRFFIGFLTEGTPPPPDIEFPEVRTPETRYNTSYIGGNFKYGLVGQKISNNIDAGVEVHRDRVGEKFYFYGGSGEPFNDDAVNPIIKSIIPNIENNLTIMIQNDYNKLFYFSGAGNSNFQSITNTLKTTYCHLFVGGNCKEVDPINFNTREINNQILFENYGGISVEPYIKNFVGIGMGGAALVNNTVQLKTPVYIGGKVGGNGSIGKIINNISEVGLGIGGNLSGGTITEIVNNFDIYRLLPYQTSSSVSGKFIGGNGGFFQGLENEINMPIFDYKAESTKITKIENNLINYSISGEFFGGSAGNSTDDSNYFVEKVYNNISPINLSVQSVQRLGFNEGSSFFGGAPNVSSDRMSNKPASIYSKVKHNTIINRIVVNNKYYISSNEYVVKFADYYGGSFNGNVGEIRNMCFLEKDAEELPQNTFLLTPERFQTAIFCGIGIQKFYGGNGIYLERNNLPNINSKKVPDNIYNFLGFDGRKYRGGRSLLSFKEYLGGNTIKVRTSIRFPEQLKTQIIPCLTTQKIINNLQNIGIFQNERLQSFLGIREILSYVGGGNIGKTLSIDNYVRTFEKDYVGGSIDNMAFTENVNNYIDCIGSFNDIGRLASNNYYGGDKTELVGSYLAPANYNALKINNYISNLVVSNYYGGGIPIYPINSIENHIGFKYRLKSEPPKAPEEDFVPTIYVGSFYGGIGTDVWTIPTNEINNVFYSSIYNYEKFYCENLNGTSLPPTNPDLISSGAGKVSLKFYGGGYQKDYSLNGNTYTMYVDTHIYMFRDMISKIKLHSKNLEVEGSTINIPSASSIELYGDVFWDDNLNGLYFPIEEYRPLFSSLPGPIQLKVNSTKVVCKRYNIEDEIPNYSCSTSKCAKHRIDRLNDYYQRSCKQNVRWPRVSLGICGGVFFLGQSLDRKIDFKSKKAEVVLNAGEFVPSQNISTPPLIKIVAGNQFTWDLSCFNSSSTDEISSIIARQQGRRDETKLFGGNNVDFMGDSGTSLIGKIHNQIEYAFLNKFVGGVCTDSANMASHAQINEIKNDILCINLNNYAGGSYFYKVPIMTESIINNISMIESRAYYGGDITSSDSTENLGIKNITNNIGMHIQEVDGKVISPGYIGIGEFYGGNGCHRDSINAIVENVTTSLYQNNKYGLNNFYAGSFMSNVPVGGAKNINYILNGPGYEEIKEINGKRYKFSSANEFILREPPKVFNKNWIFKNYDSSLNEIPNHNLKLLGGINSLAPIFILNGECTSSNPQNSINTSIYIGPHPVEKRKAELNNQGEKYVPMIEHYVSAGAYRSNSSYSINQSTITITGGKIAGNIYAGSEQSPQVNLINSIIKVYKENNDTPETTPLDIRGEIIAGNKERGSLSGDLNITIGDINTTKNNLELIKNIKVLKEGETSSSVKNINVNVYSGDIQKLDLLNGLNDTSVAGDINVIVNQYGRIDNLDIFGSTLNQTINHNKNVNIVYKGEYREPNSFIIGSVNTNNIPSVSLIIKPSKVYDGANIKAQLIKNLNYSKYVGNLNYEIGDGFKGSIQIDDISNTKESANLTISENANVTARLASNVKRVTLGNSSTFKAILDKGTASKITMEYLKLGTNSTLNILEGNFSSTDLIENDKTPIEISEVIFSDRCSIGIPLVEINGKLEFKKINITKKAIIDGDPSSIPLENRFYFEFLYPSKYSAISDVSSLPDFAQGVDNLFLGNLCTEKFFFNDLSKEQLLPKPGTISESKLNMNDIKIKKSSTGLYLGTAMSLNISIPTKLLFIGITSEKDNLIKSPEYTIINKSDKYGVNISVIGIENKGSSNQFNLANTVSDENNVHLKIKTSNTESNLLTTISENTPYELGTLNKVSDLAQTQQIKFTLVGKVGDTLKSKLNESQKLQRGAFNLKFKFTPIEN